MLLLRHLLSNRSLYVEPYISAAVPPVLTCLLGKHVGSGALPTHYKVRDLAASLLEFICRRYAKASRTLKPRVARTLLKHFIDPNKPLGTHYGALLGMQKVLGPEGIIVAVLPNLKAYDPVLSEAMKDDSKKSDVEQVLRVIRDALNDVRKSQNWDTSASSELSEEDQQKVADKVGSVVADYIKGAPALGRVILRTDWPA